MRRAPMHHSMPKYNPVPRLVIVDTPDSKTWFIWYCTMQGHRPVWDYAVAMNLTEDAAHDMMEYLQEQHPDKKFKVSRTKPFGRPE